MSGMERRNIREAISEAESAPLNFQPTERAKYVRDTVTLIEQYKRDGMSVEEIQSRVPTFVRDYKNLFEMITKPTGYDRQSLTTMLAMLDRMGSGELSQHQASVIVGERLAKKFIKIDPNTPPSN